MGNRKKVSTEYELECRGRTAQHIKALKSEAKKTNKQIAEEVDISEPTIRNYLHCRSTMKSEIARLFEEKYRYISPYWAGVTDCKTWPEYRIEEERIKEADDWENAENEGAAAYYAEVQQAETELSMLFTRCGFMYENLSHIGGFDFSPAAQWPNRITSLEDPEISACFNDKELDAIISRLRDTIALECFRKSKEPRSE